MGRYVLTGTPGSGKTAIALALERAGYLVVPEAATDVIALAQARGCAMPEQEAEFVAEITALQRQRQISLAPPGCGTMFFDRSPVCTLALARFLSRPVPPGLVAELDRITRERVYERAVFFIRNQGFAAPTAARRISFADSLLFERVHEEAYRECGFELIEVPAGPLPRRAALISQAVDSMLGKPSGCRLEG
jgi:predicted ATPase